MNENKILPEKRSALPAAKFVPPAALPIGAIPEGKLIDFLTGRLVNDTPEEYVRQNLEVQSVANWWLSPSWITCVVAFAGRL